MSRRCKRVDHVVLNSNLPIRANQKVYQCCITGNDYIINDCYYSYLYFVLRVTKSDGSPCGANDVIAIASDTSSLIRKLQVKSNGKELYDSDDLNFHIVTKHILENTKKYGGSIGQTTLFYPDKVRGVNIAKFATDVTTHAVLSRNATYNENYHKRVSITTKWRHPLYSGITKFRNFCCSYDQIMPPSNLDINLTVANYDVLIHRATGVWVLLQLRIFGYVMINYH